MSENDVTLILTAIKTLEEANKESHKDIRESIYEGLKGVQKNIDATALVTDAKIVALTDAQKRMNGNVTALQIESDKREDAFKDFKKLQESWYKLKKKWFYILIGAVLFVVIIIILYDAGFVNADSLIQKIISLFTKV